MKLWLLLIAALALPAVAQPVSLDEAVSRALSLHPHLGAAQARVRQATRLQEGAAALPTAQAGLASWQGQGELLLNANYLGQNRSDYYVFVHQQFRWPGQNETRRQLAARELESTEAGLALTRLQLTRDVKNAYLGQQLAERQLELARENLQVAEQLLRVASERFRVGSGPQIEELTASIQRHRAHQQVVAAEGERQAARIRLATLLNYPPTTVVESAATLPVLPPLPAARPAPVHPRLQSARLAVEASRLQRDQAAQQGQPTPGISAFYDVVRPSYAVQLTLSVPLDWGVLGAEVGQREEVLAEKEQVLAAEELQQAAELATSLDGYRQALAQVEGYESSILQPAAAALKATTYGYQVGATPYLQVLLMQQQLATLRQEHLQKLQAAYTALHALEFALGSPDASAGQPKSTSTRATAPKAAR